MSNSHIQIKENKNQTFIVLDSGERWITFGDWMNFAVRRPWKAEATDKIAGKCISPRSLLLGLNGRKDVEKLSQDLIPFSTK